MEGRPPSYLDCQIEDLTNMLDMTFVDIPDLVAADAPLEDPIVAEARAREAEEALRARMQRMHPQFYQDIRYVAQSQSRLDTEGAVRPIGDLPMPPEAVAVLTEVQMALASNPPHATEFVGIVQRYQTGLISGDQALRDAAAMVPPHLIGPLGNALQAIGPCAMANAARSHG